LGPHGGPWLWANAHTTLVVCSTREPLASAVGPWTSGGGGGLERCDAGYGQFFEEMGSTDPLFSRNVDEIGRKSSR